MVIKILKIFKIFPNQILKIFVTVKAKASQ
jgi:hypothetical protein